MKARIIQMVEGQMIKTETADITAWAEAAGIKILALNARKSQRAELQGQPILDKFCGPMWDGDAIRYEDAETYARMSA